MRHYHYGIILAKHESGSYTILDSILGKMTLKSQDLRVHLPIASHVRYEYPAVGKHARYLFDLEHMIESSRRHILGFYQTLCTLCFYALAPEQPSPELYTFITKCKQESLGNHELTNLCIIGSLCYKLGIYPSSSHLFARSFLLLISSHPQTMVKYIQQNISKQELATLGMWIRGCYQEILPKHSKLHDYLEIMIQDAYQVLNREELYTHETHTHSLP